jgi:hypothetical protein
MQDTENQRKTKERYLIVRLWLNDNGNYQINSSYPPTAMHPTHIEATIECERLAKQFPDIPFAIFRMEGIAVSPKSPVQWIKL